LDAIVAELEAAGLVTVGTDAEGNETWTLTATGEQIALQMSMSSEDGAALPGIQPHDLPVEQFLEVCELREQFLVAVVGLFLDRSGPDSTSVVLISVGMQGS
jgi:hypothetical protein